MSTYNEGGVPVKRSRDNLIEKWVYFANVCNFTFQFVSIEQVKECEAYFKKKIHSSTRGDHPPHEHYWHPWYCKLPKGINKGVKREKVRKALSQIIAKWG